MRRMGAETVARAAPIRAAALWAMAFSVGAALCALALPLTALHAAALSEQVSGPATFAAMLGMALACCAVRGLLLAARQRVLAQSALWLAHALGSDALARGLDTVRSPTDLVLDRVAIAQVTAGVPLLVHVGAVCAALVPLGALMVLAPLVAVVSGMAAMVVLSVIMFAAQRLRVAVAAAAVAAADADAAWHKASASSVVIAARGLTASVVLDWQGVHGKAVVRAHAASQWHVRCATIVDALHGVSLVVAIAVAVLATGAAAVGQLAALVLLHDAVLRPAAALARDLPAMIAARAALAEVVAPSTPSVLEMPRAEAASVSRPQTRVPPRRAEAS